MCNHTAVAKAVVAASCALAVALFTIGMGVNFTWAGSDPSNYELKLTPISSEAVFQPAHRSITMPRLAQNTPKGGVPKNNDPKNCASGKGHWDDNNQFHCD